MHISTHTTSICFLNFIRKKIHSSQNRIRISPCSQILSQNKVLVHLRLQKILRIWICRLMRPQFAHLCRLQCIFEGCWRSTFDLRKNVISQSGCSNLHAMVTLLYQTLQSRVKIWCGNSAHKGDGYTGRNIAFKIATKSLQIETWLLLTAYRNSSSP